MGWISKILERVALSRAAKKLGEGAGKWAGRLVYSALTATGLFAPELVTDYASATVVIVGGLVTLGITELMVRLRKRLAGGK